LKILFALGFPNPFAGAAWTRIGFLAEIWSKKNVNVAVLGTFRLRSFQETAAKRFGRTTIYNLIPNVYPSHPIFFLMNSLSSLVVSSFFLIAKKPDIVIISLPTGDVGLGTILACRLLKIRYIVDYRDRWEDYNISISKNKVTKKFYLFVRKLMMKLYRFSTALVAVSPKVVHNLKLQVGSNVELMPNGADINVFKPISGPRNPGNFILVYISGPVDYYDLNLVLKALKILANKNLPNLKLFLIGKMPQSIMKDLMDLDIADRVILFGEVNNYSQLAELIAQGDVGLLPLSVDYVQAKTALPVKFFEYCACGLPVIATASHDSILAEFVEKKEVGLIVPSMNEDKFADAIYQVYINKSYREAASKRARVLVENDFDRNKISETYFALLVNLLTGES
jgi:glycosyltransferase involved in cell wall biosynthesis